MKKSVLLSLVLVAVSAGLVFAGASDPFAKATSKTEELVGFISTFAMYAATLVLVVVGVMTMFNKVRVEWFYKIAGGAAIILAAGSIGKWLFA